MSIMQYILKSDHIFCSDKQGIINGYIIIQNNKIQSVENGPIPSSLQENYPIYDLSGKTILPGFFDAHTSYRN